MKTIFFLWLIVFESSTIIAQHGNENPKSKSFKDLAFSMTYVKKSRKVTFDSLNFEIRAMMLSSSNVICIQTMRISNMAPNGKQQIQSIRCFKLAHNLLATVIYCTSIAKKGKIVDSDSFVSVFTNYYPFSKNDTEQERLIECTVDMN